MCKGITASVVALLVLGSSAMGQVNLQFHGWNLGVTNNINLSGGTSEGETTQGIGTLSVQDLGINPDEGGDPTAGAAQGIGAVLFQTGGATTGGGSISVVQGLNVVGVGIEVNDQELPAGQTGASRFPA